ncbi:MAG: hypothetical protein FJY29_10555 [Betaproteobacteria bacterium]|nr:hypothetical protein [Betaproteobacteria bacterium]
MKHVNEAQKLYAAGDGTGSLQILEDLLDLAPRNPEALRLKARILDSWGRFEESYQTLLKLSQLPNPSEEVVQEIEQRANEEREAILFSELTSEGRWYYAFPGSQLWVSIAGLVGCVVFLLTSAQVRFTNPNEVITMALSFVFLVLLPCVALLAIQMTGIKRILVGLRGLSVCTRFRERVYAWDELKVAVIEFDQDPRVDFLRLKIFGQNDSHVPLLNFDISRNGSVVRARRHFLKNILTHVDTVSYVTRAASGVRMNRSFDSEDSENSNKNPPQAS